MTKIKHYNVSIRGGEIEDFILFSDHEKEIENIITEMTTEELKRFEAWKLEAKQKLHVKCGNMNTDCVWCRYIDEVFGK